MWVNMLSYSHIYHLAVSAPLVGTGYSPAGIKFLKIKVKGSYSITFDEFESAAFRPSQHGRELIILFSDFDPTEDSKFEGEFLGPDSYGIFSTRVAFKQSLLNKFFIYYLYNIIFTQKVNRKKNFKIFFLDVYTKFFHKRCQFKIFDQAQLIACIRHKNFFKATVPFLKEKEADGLFISNRRYLKEGAFDLLVFSGIPIGILRTRKKMKIEFLC